MSIGWTEYSIDMMKVIMRHIFMACLAVLFVAGGCVTNDFDDQERETDVPEGYALLKPKFVVEGNEYNTRAIEDILNYIEDVHIFIFELPDGEEARQLPDGRWTMPDDIPVSVRNFREYDEANRKLYLRSRGSYFIFVLANLDDRYVPGGDVDEFLAGIQTYGDLKDLYVQAINYSAEEVGKMMMASAVEPISLEVEGELEVFVPEIYLRRLRSQFIVTVYNKVTETGENLSGVYPSAIAFEDVPRYGYVIERPVNESEPYDMSYSLGADGYYTSTTNLMSSPSPPERITVRSTKTGVLESNWYTSQQLTFYCLENRRGTVSEQEIEQWLANNAPPGTPDVYARKALAPALSTYAMLTSLTDGDILHTYFYAGKGRDVEENPEFTDPPGTPSEYGTGNYDVDRSCVYHFNVFINGVEDVIIDSRREFLGQDLVITHSDDFDRLDAHYMDIPVYVQSRSSGYFKMEAGLGTGANWRPMTTQGLSDDERWLTMSWNDPYPGDSNVAYAVHGPLAVGANGMAEATPVFHLNEYVNTTDRVSFQAGVIAAVDNNGPPPRRTATVRVGFVGDATTEAGYNAGQPSYIYFDVSQYGLKTIGPVGGYVEGEGYQTLLGIESVEEYYTQFYIQGPNLDVVRPGLPWRYLYGPGAGSAEGQYTYDGFNATKYRYGEYRRSNNYPGGVPPKRGEVNIAPVTAPYPDLVYNPYSNTNATDYCVRKNRDSDGNGFIEGDELKWYLPAIPQLTMMFNFRNSFRGNEWMLNQVGYKSYEPFGVLSPFYWTTAEEIDTTGEPNSYVVDFSQNTARVTVSDKNSSNYIRCVRDIHPDAEGVEHPPYIYDDGVSKHVVIDMTDIMPEESISDNKADILNGSNQGGEQLRQTNTLARAFIVSRWYGSGSANHLPTPITGGGDANLCANYTEPGYEGRKWIHPSLEELRVILRNLEVIEHNMATAWPAGSYDTFVRGAHWSNYIGSNGPRSWTIEIGRDPVTGNLSFNEVEQQKNKALCYFRCVLYLDTSDGGSDSENIPPRNQ